jgi:hypothetical protein
MSMCGIFYFVLVLIILWTTVHKRYIKWGWILFFNFWVIFSTLIKNYFGPKIVFIETFHNICLRWPKTIWICNECVIMHFGQICEKTSCFLWDYWNCVRKNEMFCDIRKVMWTKIMKRLNLESCQKNSFKRLYIFNFLMMVWN